MVFLSTSTNLNFNPYCMSGKYDVLQEIDGTITSSPLFNGDFF